MGSGGTSTIAFPLWDFCAVFLVISAESLRFALANRKAANHREKKRNKYWSVYFKWSSNWKPTGAC